MNEQILTAVEIEVIDSATKALQEIKQRFSGLTDEVNKQKGFLAKHKEEIEKVSKAALVMGGAILGSAFLVGKAAQEQIQANQQLEAVLKSTKNAAGVSADEARNLASALQDVTNFGDQTILSAQNLLLTFTNIKKDVFPQATETVLNMSQALGQDLRSSAVQLGKALQDPINGVNALRRVGVNFTDDQKKMIETLVQTGRGMEAQKIILKELETEFGGSARAAANPIVQLKNAIGDVAEELGNAFLPAVKEMAKNIIPVVKNIGEWIKAHPQLTAVIAKVVIAVGGLLVVLGTIGTVIPKLVAAWKALSLVMNPYGLIILAIVAALTALYLWVTKTETGKKALAATLRVLGAIVSAVSEGIHRLSLFLQAVWNVSAPLRALIAEGLNRAFQQLASIAQAAGNALSWVWAKVKDVGDIIKNYVIDKINALINVLRKIPGVGAAIDFITENIEAVGEEYDRLAAESEKNSAQIQTDLDKVGEGAAGMAYQFNQGTEGAGGGVEDLKDKVKELRKTYYDTVVDVNRKLLELKVNHRNTMKDLEKDITGVQNEMEKLTSAYKKSTQEMLDAHNKLLAGLTGEKADSVIAQFEKIKQLQQEISDASFNEGAPTADQLVTVIENRQDKGDTLSARDKRAFNVSDDTEEQINKILELRKEQEALVKVLNDNYDIAKELKTEMNNTFGERQITAIQSIIAANKDLDKSFKFAGLTEIEQEFSKIKDKTTEANAEFTKQQTEKNQSYTEEMFNLRTQKKELEDKKNAAEKAYQSERRELIATKQQLQDFATTYIDNINNVEKVTTEKLESMKAKLEELKNTIASIDALLQRKAEITGGETVTQAAQKPRTRSARGDVFVKPTTALIAEGGQAEAVVPLPDGRSIPVKLDSVPSQPASMHVEVNLGGVTIANEFDLRRVVGTIVNAVENQMLKAGASPIPA